MAGEDPSIYGYTEMYNMSRKMRGQALIFNLLVKHPCGDADVRALRETLNILKFDVIVPPVKNTRDILKTIDQAAKDEKNNDADCILVAFTAHGTEKGEIETENGLIHIDSIFNLFTPENTNGLVGKPKIFLFDACRGDEMENALHKVDAIATGRKVSPHLGIPLNADFCVIYSSMQGYASYLEAKGSWLIQDLCKELRRNVDQRRDFMTILTLTLGRVAYSRGKIEYPGCFKKQMPVVLSTLTKLLYF